MIVSRTKQIHFIFTDVFVRFVITGRKQKIIQCRQRHLPEGIIVDGKINDFAALFSLMKNWMSENKIGSMQASFCIPDGQAIVRRVSVPDTVPADEVKGHLYMEIGESIHLPFNDPILEVTDLRKMDLFGDVLFIATRESIVQEYSELLRKLKLEPVVADLTFLSVYRLAFKLDLVHDTRPVLLVQLNTNSLQLTIFQKHVPLYVHHSRLEEEISFEVKVNEDGNDISVVPEHERESFFAGAHVTISSQIERITSFFTYNIAKGSEEIQQMIVSGCHPLLHELANELKNQLNIPLNVIDEKRLETITNHHFPSYFADCLGLAIK